MPGIKHLIECHCYLAIYKKQINPVNHKFPVYSKIDDNGNVIKKNVKCNNCDAFHLVYDLCKSEIKAGKEKMYPPQDTGEVVIFPSFFLHGVEPVLSGTRHTVVSWLRGTRFR